MKWIGQLMLVLLVLCNPTRAAEKFDEVYVDPQGVMRHKGSGKEASFFGVNYTLPFAHAFRAVGYLGEDPKKCIDNDVYHIARLGMNAYRIHIWDVEISDSAGNLLQNRHLDLLDYLMASLQERGIYIVVTLQTNFGNGYPERNISTGGFSYLYDKCNIHSDSLAVEAQKRYARALVSHVNPYNGKRWGEDPAIVGFEINNEPCHSVSPEDTRHYLGEMTEAIRSERTRKPIFYNVSHNMGHQGAYYGADIQGTTFQWYPIGLVGGHTRKGNFLPFVDSFHIPFDTVPGYADKARLVYEFDPADILYSYMYPAMSRTFRSAGFQWITQFAYDPMALGWANTEYQTHYLNLAYTPRKALSMKIAAEVAREIPRGANFGAYPADTLFGNFIVSYERDLSMYNSFDKYFYSNHTDIQPRRVSALTEIAGYGNSPILSYEGTGAYFLDKVKKGVWRLEVMPDEVTLSDPFKKTSLKRQVSAIQHNRRRMTVKLPDLGQRFLFRGINENNMSRGEANNRSVELLPGTYLLIAEGVAFDDHNGKIRNIGMTEYVAPQNNVPGCRLNHQSNPAGFKGEPVKIRAVVAASGPIDSVLLYTDKISFWNDENPYLILKESAPFIYETVVPEESTQEKKLRYNLVVYSEGKSYTWPEGTEGMPLDWDYVSEQFYETPLFARSGPLTLLNPAEMNQGQEIYTIPEWNEPGDKIYYLKKYVKEIFAPGCVPYSDRKVVEVACSRNLENVTIGFTDAFGYTYEAVPEKTAEGKYACKFSDLQLAPTLFLPHAYPVFLAKSFMPEQKRPFDPARIEYVQIATSTPLTENMLTISLK